VTISFSIEVLLAAEVFKCYTKLKRSQWYIMV